MLKFNAEARIISRFGLILILNFIVQKKQTPLHLAASAGQESVCALLLELGASLDSTDDYGQKPIHLAAQSNKSEVVKLFLKQRPQLVSVTTRVKNSNVLFFVKKVIKMVWKNFKFTGKSFFSRFGSSSGSLLVVQVPSLGFSQQ